MATDPELLAAVGPRVRKSPFFDATVRAGVTAMSTYNHMWLPMSYGDPAAEYERLTTGVSMWDVAAQRHVGISGADDDALVQLVSAVDIGRAAPGHSIYAPIVDHEGTLLNDPVLLHWPDGTWRFSIADSDVSMWIAAVAHGHGLDASVDELDTATLAVQGPSAFEVTAALGLGWATELQPSEMRPTTLELDGRRVELVVSRSGWSSQGGVELFLDEPAWGGALWDAVAEAGAPFGIGPGAPNATERIENVLLSYGTDTGYHADPIELGLTDHLDLDGPDFIGRDALRRIREEGPARRLLGAVIEGDDIGVLASPVPLVVRGAAGHHANADDRDTTDEDVPVDDESDRDVVGALRAATHSPRFGCNIGLALVDGSCNPGTTGCVQLADGERVARLIDLPFTESLVAATG